MDLVSHSKEEVVDLDDLFLNGGSELPLCLLLRRLTSRQCILVLLEKVLQVGVVKVVQLPFRLGRVLNPLPELHRLVRAGSETTASHCSFPRILR